MSASGRPVALVTGASRGLGFLIAREFARRGHDLLIAARSSDGLTAAGDDLRGHGVEVRTVAADVGDRGDAAALVAEAEQHFGRLDVVVTNAGVVQVGPASTMRLEDYEQAMHVMFWGTVHPILAAMPLLRRAHGRVLAITSVGGKLPPPHLLPYAAAKHAAVGFAEGLRIEAAAEGVSVTVAVPGLMRTGSTRNALFSGDRAAEQRWFTVAASLPVVSMDAERAARRLVAAVMRGRPEVTLTPLAKLGVRVHALAPSTTMRALTVANRLLPSATATATDTASDTTRSEPGHAVGPQPRWFQRLVRNDATAARRWHEHDDPSTAEPA